MKNYKIKTATAEYTGGGIYIYYGQLENGLYFRSDDSFDFVSICDSDTSTDEADYGEFYDEHERDTLTGKAAKEFFNKIILWILKNKPQGNYNSIELENRLKRIQ